MKISKYEYGERNIYHFDNYASKETLESKVLDAIQLLKSLPTMYETVFLATSFFKESLVLTHLITQAKLPITLFYADLGIIPEEFTPADYESYNYQQEQYNHYKKIHKTLRLQYNPQIHLRRFPILIFREFFKGSCIIVDGSYPAEACAVCWWNKFVQGEKDKEDWGIMPHKYGLVSEIYPLWKWSLDDVILYLERYNLLPEKTLIRTSKYLV